MKLSVEELRELIRYAIEAIKTGTTLEAEAEDDDHVCGSCVGNAEVVEREPNGCPGMNDCPGKAS